VILLSAKLAPVDNVNVFDPVNTNLSSTDELKLKFALAVERPPAFEKKGTTIAFCSAPPEPVTATAILFVPALDPSGNVAPVAAILIVPVPSDEIVAPSRLMELEDK